ncbi:hypothetical protein FPV67DRAFT_808910 [Lyophyllum atratum]|nr:hypothetical protein FPV67DRAFT_808910 [Lyophyllum atratum]
MSTITIPSELSDRVIDHCHDDKATLRSCSIVCKDWVAASRYHLFSSVVLKRRHLLRFLDLLQSPLGISVGHWVTNLDILIYFDLSIFDAMPMLSQHLRPRSLTLVVDTTSNDYHQLSAGHQSRGYLTAFHGCFPTLLSLNIKVVYGTFLEMVELVTSFPLLEKLAINHPCGEVQSKKMPPQYPALPSQISELTIARGNGSLYRWLSQHNPPLYLTRLTLDIVHNGKRDYKFINAFLNSIDRSLPYLCLRASGTADSILKHIDLAHLHDLRSLKVDAPENAVAIILRFLLKLSSTAAVEEVEFSPWFDPDDASSWLQLDHLVKKNRFSNLQRVILNISRESLHIHVTMLVPTINSLRSILWFRDKSGVARRIRDWSMRES